MSVVLALAVALNGVGVGSVHAETPDMTEQLQQAGGPAGGPLPAQDDPAGQDAADAPQNEAAQDGGTSGGTETVDGQQSADGGEDNTSEGTGAGEEKDSEEKEDKSADGAGEDTGTEGETAGSGEKKTEESEAAGNGAGEPETAGNGTGEPEAAGTENGGAEADTEETETGTTETETGETGGEIPENGNAPAMWRSIENRPMQRLFMPISAPAPRAGEKELPVTSMQFSVNNEKLSGGPSGAPELKKSELASAFFDIVVAGRLDDALGGTSEGTVYVYDMNGKLTNLTLEDVPETELKDEHGTVLGTWSLSGNKLYIKPNAAWDAMGNRSWNVKLSGKLNQSGAPFRDGSAVPVGVGSYQGYFTYVDDGGASSLNVYKSNANTPVYKKADGKLYQKFTVTMTANGGKVTFPSGALTDTAGKRLKALSDTSAVTVENAGGISGLGSASTFGALKSALQGKELGEGKSVTFSYEMEVDTAGVTDGLSGKLSWNEDCKNTVTVKYQDSKGKTQTVKSETYTWYQKPTVEKTGSMGADKVSWTIKIVLNSLDPKNASTGDTLPDSIIKEIQDTLANSSKYYQGATSPLTITASNFKRDASGAYVYTYETTLSETAKTRYPLTLKNDVEITDQFGDTAQTSAVVSKTPGPGAEEFKIEKKLKTADEAGKELTWEITTGTVPSGLQKLTLQEQPWGNHKITKITMKIDAGGDTQIYPAGGGGSGPTYDDATKTVDFGSSLTDYEGKKLTFTVTTKIEDDDLIGMTYSNNATLKFQYSDEDTEYSYQSYAQWAKKSVVTKDGYQDIDIINRFHYTVTVDLNDELYKDNKAKGTDIIITDELAAAMKYMDKTVSVWLNGTEEITGSSAADYSTGPGGKGGTLKVTVPISAVRDGAYNLQLKYDTEIKDLADLYNSGDIWWRYGSHINRVSAEIDDADSPGASGGPVSLGGAKKEIQVYTDSINMNTVKSVEAARTLDGRLDGEARQQYTLKINPGSMDLVDGEKLTAVDKLGSALEYVKDSVTVCRMTSEGTAGEVLPAGQYSLSFGQEGDASTLTFTLPDETPILIRYDARIREDVKTVNASSGSNTFTIDGKGSMPMRGSSNIDGIVFRRSGGASGSSVGIYIHKYWSDETGERIPLSGCEFQVTLQDKSDITTADPNVRGETILADTTREETKWYRVDGILLDTVYCLTETEAESGYDRWTEPYYFYVEGKGLDRTQYVNADSYRIVEGGAAGFGSGDGTVTIHKWTNNDIIEYANRKKDGTGTLVIRKTIPGGVTREEAEGALEFSVTDAVTGIGQLYTLKDGFVYREADGSMVWTKTLSCPAGTYTVEETVKTIGGHTLTSATCKVGDDVRTVKKAEDELKTAAFGLASGGRVRAEFEDRYQSASGGTVTQNKPKPGNKENKIEQVSESGTADNGGSQSSVPKTGDDRFTWMAASFWAMLASGAGMILTLAFGSMYMHRRGRRAAWRTL